MAPSTEQAVDGELTWHRPHPFTVVLEIGSALRSMAIAIVVVGGNFLETGFAVELAVVAAPLAAAIGRWYTTRYALGPESVHYRYGLLRRRKQVMPRANVQNVSTKSGLLSRFASVTELHISDASATGDIKLRLVSMEEADRLTALLRSDRPATTDGAAVAAPWWAGEEPTGGPSGPGTPVPASTGPAGTGPMVAGPFGWPPPGPAKASGPPTAVGAERPTVADGGPVWRRPDVESSLSRLLWAEITSMPVVTAAVATVLVPLVTAAVAWQVDTGLDVLDRSGRIIIGIPVVMIVITTVSVLQRLAVLGGFQLHAEPDRLRIRAGLLTEARIAARRERIQQLEVQRDLLHRLVGIERVRYETADVETQGTAATTFLSLAADTDDWRHLTELAIGGTRLDEQGLRTVSPRTIRRSMIRALPLVALTTVLAGLVWVYLAPVALAATSVGARWYARRRYQVLGWDMDDEHYLLRTGVVANRLHLIRLDKVQAVRTRATLFQRRLGLTDVSVSTAGTGGLGLVTVPDLPDSTAWELVSTLAARSARTPLADTL